MKIYDFFIRLSRLPCIIICKNHCEDGSFFTYYYTRQLNDLAEWKRNHKFSSLVFIGRPDAKCLQCYSPFSYFGLWHLPNIAKSSSAFFLEDLKWVFRFRYYLNCRKKQYNEKPKNSSKNLIARQANERPTFRYTSTIYQHF